MKQVMTGSLCLLLLAACGSVDDRSVNEGKGGSAGSGSSNGGAANRAGASNKAGAAGAGASSANGGKTGVSVAGNAGQLATANGGQAGGAAVGVGGQAGGAAVGVGGQAGGAAVGIGGQTGGTAGIAGAAATSTACIVGAKRCASNSVEVCQANNTWVAAPAANQCGGIAPVCTGAGLCAAYRLVSGTIDTFGPTPAPATGALYILKRQTLMFGYASDATGKRVCSTGANALCVTGGITPESQP